MQLEGFWLPRWRSDTEAHLHYIKQVLYSGKSEYQKIDIVEFVGYGKSLILDGIHQFAQADEFIYQEAITHPPLCLHSNPKEILIIGAGGGNALRETLKHNSVKSVVIIDIDKQVVDKCREYIGSDQGAFDDPRTELIIEDGASFLRSTNRRFDCIFVDSTTPKPGSIAYDLYSPKFFQEAWEKLNDGGMLCGFQSNANILFLDSHCTIRHMLEDIFKEVLSYIVYCPFYAISYLITISVKNFSIDPFNIDHIKSRIDPIRSKLKFYDEATHIHMFNLPRYVREAIADSVKTVDLSRLIKY